MRTIPTLLLTMSLYSTAGMGQPSDKQEFAAFDEEMASLRKANFIPGLAVAVVKDGELAWAKGYGFRDNNNEVPVTPDTPFWIASVTKTFVGLAFLHLQQAGEADFEALAAETPEFSGLCEWLAGTTIPFAKGLDCAEAIRIRHILHHQVNKPVGTQFLYNPIMYSRLSRYLEHKLGEGVRGIEGRHNYLGQSIDKYILEPAGMTRTMASMWDDDKVAVYFDLADGFKVDSEGYKQRMKRPERHIAGGAGIVSTVLDLAKYDKAISEGTIASGAIKEQLLKPADFLDGTPSPYGFGWYFQCYQNEKLMWHGGWDPDNGYSAIYLRLPERNMAFIALANGEGLWWGNPPGKAQIEGSDFVQAFFKHIGLDNLPDKASCAL